MALDQPGSRTFPGGVIIEHVNVCILPNSKLFVWLIVLAILPSEGSRIAVLYMYAKIQSVGFVQDGLITQRRRCDISN